MQKSSAFGSSRRRIHLKERRRPRRAPCKRTTIFMSGAILIGLRLTSRSPACASCQNSSQSCLRRIDRTLLRPRLRACPLFGRSQVPLSNRKGAPDLASELHVIQEVPSLRTVDDVLWEQVKTARRIVVRVDGDWRCFTDGLNVWHDDHVSRHRYRGSVSSASRARRSAQAPLPERPHALAATTKAGLRVQQSRSLL